MTPTNRARNVFLSTAAATLLAAAPASAQPATIQLTGKVRDFKAFNEPGGHPAFERANASDDGVQR